MDWNPSSVHLGAMCTYSNYPQWSGVIYRQTRLGFRSHVICCPALASAQHDARHFCNNLFEIPTREGYNVSRQSAIATAEASQQIGGM
jgi:hypothetical protein